MNSRDSSYKNLGCTRAACTTLGKTRSRKETGLLSAFEGEMLAGSEEGKTRLHGSAGFRCALAQLHSVGWEPSLPVNLPDLPSRRTVNPLSFPSSHRSPTADPNQRKCSLLSGDCGAGKLGLVRVDHHNMCGSRD